MNTPLFTERQRTVVDSIPDIPVFLKTTLDMTEQIRPAISTSEAIALLDSFNGIAAGIPVDIGEMPHYLAETVFSCLIAEEEAEELNTLEKLEQLSDRPKFKLAKRLKTLVPLEAAALFIAIQLWWGNRKFLGDNVTTENPETLKLEEYFTIAI